MRHIENYNQFITFLIEKRNLSSRDKISVANRIVDFLKKYNYNFEGTQKDSKIFVSFKTGDFETIVPSRSLGGNQYSSPQGFYCFDMNGFKPRLFGDNPISPENFNENNLSQASNTILDLGLGYGNNGNKVDSENIWNEWNGIPRYLYFVKVKDDSLILSNNSNALKFYDPLNKLLRLYSHNFLKDSESKVFDPKDKRDNGLDKKSHLEIKAYFKENKEKYNSNFIEKLLNLFNKIEKDEKDLHVIMYKFLISCCSTISRDNYYVRFTLLCKSIGIDGFTQRRGENYYIHYNPKFQTVLLTESCKEDLMKIDLRKELRIDQYVKGEKSKINLDPFLESMKKGDVLFNKKTLSFTRFISPEDFKKTIGGARDEKKLVINTGDFVKVDLDNNTIWNFIKNIKSGDWIRIACDTSESSNYNKVIESMIVQFNDVVNTDDVITFDTRGKKLQERVISNQSLHFNINGERLVNQKYPYKLEKKDSETPLFNPQSINIPEYKYWVDNKKDLESKGVKFDEFIDEWERDDIVNNLEELFTNKNYGSEYNRVRIYTDMDLLTMLSNFKNNYSDRVFSSNYTKNFVKDAMKLYYYTGGEINKPFKVINSTNPIF